MSKPSSKITKLVELLQLWNNTDKAVYALGPEKDGEAGAVFISTRQRY